MQRPPLVDYTELTRFHSDDYINFLRIISPDNINDHLRELQRCESFLRISAEVRPLTVTLPTRTEIRTPCTDECICMRPLLAS